MAFIEDTELYKKLKESVEGRKIIAEAPKLSDYELNQKINEFAKKEGIDLQIDDDLVVLKEVDELIKETGAKGWRRGLSWKDFDVYIPVFEKTLKRGRPLVVLVSDDNVRYSDYDESYEYLKYLQEKLGIGKQDK